MPFCSYPPQLDLVFVTAVVVSTIGTCAGRGIIENMRNRICCRMYEAVLCYSEFRLPQYGSAGCLATNFNEGIMKCLDMYYDINSVCQHNCIYYTR